MHKKIIKLLFIVVFVVVLMSSQIYAEEFNDFDIINPSDILLVQNPETVEEFERVLLFMAVTDTYKFHIPYSDKQVNLSNLDIAMDNVNCKYPEYFGLINILDRNTESFQGVIRLSLYFKSNAFVTEQLKEYKKVFFNETKKTIDSLKDNKIITDEMNDYEKAKEVYYWIAINTVYDESLEPISHGGYSVMVNKTAVCDGYTSVNNLMLKMLGIKDVIGIFGKGKPAGHIWTRVNLDGNIVYIDSTWGDPTPDEKGYCDFKYFAVDREFLENEHKRAGLVWEETY